MKNNEQKEAMIIEEESSINLQGPEMVGHMGEIWTNLEKFEKWRENQQKGKSNFMPSLDKILEYIGKNDKPLFPLNTNPYQENLVNEAFKKLKGKHNLPTNPNLL